MSQPPATAANAGAAGAAGAAAPTTGTPARKKGSVGLLAAVSIGVGGMIGAGIFSILGVVASVSGSALPVSFAIGGFIALLAAYSYTKLGTRFPTSGGSVQFLVEGLGDGILSGGLNVFQYLAYVISMALYAAGFAGYAITFLPSGTPSWVQRLLAAGLIVVFAGVNFLGSKVVGRAESVIVIIKVTILVVFIIGAFFSLDSDRLSPSTWPSGLDIVFGAGILFVGYEGFGLITNAAADMGNPKRELPKAIYLAVGIVIAIYVLVAVGVIGNIPIPALEQAKDYALAEAAKPFLGQAGFKLIAIAAVLSTSSAVNATLYGASNVSYQIARDGQLPTTFTNTLWHRHVEGLFITAGLSIAFVLAFDLGPIAMMASAAFLIVYAAVNAAHLRIRAKTGANAAMIIASLVACSAMFVLLMVYIVQHAPSAAWITLVATLVASFAIEVVYRRRTGRRFHRLEDDPSATIAPAR
jgi:amino acid transporter